MEGSTSVNLRFLGVLNLRPPDFFCQETFLRGGFEFNAKSLAYLSHLRFQAEGRRRMSNHLRGHGDGFLVDLIVAKNFHLAAEQLRGAAVSHRQHATAMSVCSQFRFGQHMKIVVAAGDSERERSLTT